MSPIAQYISDLRETDLLRNTIDEYLSVCVIPVETDSRAPIMANVRIKVLLPLDREVFVTGTVIMHRSDGFLVQMDCTLDLDFLRSTLLQAIAAESGIPLQHAHRPAAGGGSVPDADVGQRPPSTQPAAPEPAAADSARPQTYAGGTTGRIQGKVNITERVEILEPVAAPRKPIEPAREKPAPEKALRTADEAARDTPPPARNPRKGEVTASYFEKPAEIDSSPQSAPVPPEQEDLTISSISAVDAVTGKPMRPEPRASRNEKTTPVTDVDRDAHDRLDNEFAPRTSGGDRQGSKPLTRQEVTRKYFSPDVIERARAETLRESAASGLVGGSAPVDELFSLAAEAGAIDIADSGLLDVTPEPEKTSPSIPGTVDVTQTIIERTKPRFRRPPGIEPPAHEEPPAETAPVEPAPDVAETNLDAETQQGRAVEPENREMAVRIREMSTPEKQKLARQGKRIARRILVRDNDKTIHKYVFFNPEIQIDEVIEYTRFNGLAQDAIEFITTNRIWMESRDVVFNIVRNPSTPTEIAVRFVIKLTPADWRMFVRPGVVKPAVMNQARKLLLESEKKF